LSNFSQFLSGEVDHAELKRAAFDEGFWSTLLPVEPPRHQTRNAVQAMADVDDLRRTGVFAVPGAIDTPRLERVHKLLKILRRRGWPLVFAAMHDALWEVFSAPPLGRALEQLLGRGCRQVPRFWITHVSSVEGDAGWRPHLDAHEKPIWNDIGPDRLTVWIALTEATVDNGCMFVLPPEVAGEFPSDLFESRELSAARILPLLHAARPLPCQAGTVMGWTKNVVHWGGRSTGEAAAPRIAIATEFIQGRCQTDLREDAPLDSLAGPPEFSRRLRLVGQQILKYVEYDREARALAPFVELAHRMYRA
jgi:hypothetical protein